MPPDLDRRFRPRMTLRQIGVLVVFAAVAMAVVTPIGRSAADSGQFVLRSAIELPYVLILPTLILVRRGPLKGWMVAALCGVPLVAFLTFLNLLGLTGRAGPDFQMGDLPTAGLVVLGMADALILGGLAYLGRWVIPRFCPTCRRRAMLRDPSVPRSRAFPRPGDARTCLACGSRFRRSRRGPWVDVDAPTYEPIPGDFPPLTPSR